MRKPASTTAPRWPFWLLIVAWVCANSPQVATYAVLAWLAEARQFSHQQQLTRDVAHLLSGEKTPARETTVVVASDRGEEKASRPAVPAASVLKKIDLSTEKLGEHVGLRVITGRTATVIIV